jgi:hypothetical protein
MLRGKPFAQGERTTPPTCTERTSSLIESADGRVATVATRREEKPRPTEKQKNQLDSDRSFHEVIKLIHGNGERSAVQEWLVFREKNGLSTEKPVFAAGGIFPSSICRTFFCTSVSGTRKANTGKRQDLLIGRKAVVGH